MHWLYSIRHMTLHTLHTGPSLYFNICAADRRCGAFKCSTILEQINPSLSHFNNSAPPLFQEQQNHRRASYADVEPYNIFLNEKMLRTTQCEKYTTSIVELANV